MSYIPPPPYYALPKCCPKCGNKKSLEERINPFTSGVPVAGGSFRLRLGVSRGLFQFRHRVRYVCKKCGFDGLYHDRKETWKELK